jgi:hypothetical protein
MFDFGTFTEIENFTAKARKREDNETRVFALSRLRGLNPV